MKIAFVVINANRYEGTSRAVLEVAERLASDHDVDLWARTVGDADTARLRWVRVRGFGRPEIADFATYKWQADWRLRRSNYDIIHSAGPNTSVADVYTIQTVHPVKVRLMAAARAQASAGVARRLSWQAYDRYVVRAERQAYTAVGPRGRRAFLPVSSGTQSELLDVYPQVCADADHSNVHIVPNGADLELFHPGNRDKHRRAVRGECGLGEGDFVMVFSGGDWRRKGLDLALQALASIDEPAIKLLVVGHDRAGADVRTLAENLGLSARVVFAGFRSDVHRYYAAADLFLFPTSYEAFSVASIEAAASGLPVLMSDVSGAAELVGSGAAGSLIRRQPEHIAHEILRYYRAPSLVRETGVAARQLVEQQFSWDAITRQTTEVYSQLLAVRQELKRDARSMQARPTP